MSKAEFSTARSFALETQKMDQTLETISNMIVVCDVHCAADDYTLRGKTDWYKILQVDHNADTNAISKQYKNLALLIHPDKNKLPGAEAAFKLIGEARELLCDKEKRAIVDIELQKHARRKKE